MASLTMTEMAAPYIYVVSDDAVSEVRRLLEAVPSTEATNVVSAAGPSPTTRSILELEGLGADAWNGVDAQQYIQELRDEWDSR